MKPVHIYILIDPRTNEIRYVGKSIRPHERLTNHMNDKSECHRTHWLRELKAIGLRPRIEIVETLQGDWPWQDSERIWIAKLKHMGARLVNNTSGGDGAPDLPPETRERIRQASIGRRPTAEQKARAVASRAANYRVSDETRRKHSAAMKGRKILWIDKISEVNRKIHREFVPSVKNRLDLGERVKDLAMEYGVHRTTISKIKTGRYLNAGQRH